MRLQTGDLVADKYRIESLLGEGGMGAVYVAENEVLHKRVALKMVSEGAMHPEVVQRFFREGIAASRVRHRCIVEIFDAGSHEGAPWMAMELLEGETLANRLERDRRLLPRECVGMALELLSGLAAAHAHGIVHRDLKPDNIFLERHPDGSVQPKILDFGIAKLLDAKSQKLTSAGAFLGTALYLAPEQALDSGEVDARADLYAIGVVLFEALSARLPIEATTLSELVSKLLSGEPARLESLAPDIPAALAEVVHRCLRREPAERPQSADELARLLAASVGLAHEPSSRLYLSEREPASRRGELVGSIVDGRYRILSRLGSGGMGEVFEAEHVRIGRRFALKILRAELTSTPGTLARFEREARAAGAIGNRHIVEVSDMGQLPNGQPFIVMERLQGRDLEAELEKSGPLPVARTVRIATQVARALGAAHQKGIIHRDLKPENVFLVEEPEESDFVKVLDFGISKVHEAAQGIEGSATTRTGIALGTPHYMAPEQAEAQRDIDGRADVYALGVMLFRMLIGKLPYDAPSYTALLLKVAREPPPSLRAMNAAIPSALETVVQRAMAKDRSDRFASMEALAEALAPFASNESAPAPAPAEPGETPQGFRIPTEAVEVPMQRSRVAPLAVGGVLILLVGALVYAKAGPSGATVGTSSAATSAPEALSVEKPRATVAPAPSAPATAAATTPAPPAPTAAARSAAPRPSVAAPPASAAPAATRQVAIRNDRRAAVQVVLSCGGKSAGASVPAGGSAAVTVAATSCSVSCSGVGSPSCSPVLAPGQSVVVVR